MSDVPRWIGAGEIARRVPMRAAIDALRARLGSGGFDPETETPRSSVATARGQLLLMPSSAHDFVGTKVVSVAPGNPAAGRPRVQAVYVLMDAATLTPIAMLEGAALTALRTPAMSAVAADLLAHDDAAHLAVFGTGPQAWGHVLAMREIRPITRVSVVGRHRARTAALVERVTGLGLTATAATADVVRDADLMVCATSAADPLFDGSLVQQHACVVAIGSHEPDRREVDAALLGRSTVVVESIASALSEAGDVVLAIAEQSLRADALVSIARAVQQGWVMDPTRPRVFKGVGMAWQDLAVAAVVVEAGARLS